MTREGTPQPVVGVIVGLTHRHNTILIIFRQELKHSASLYVSEPVRAHMEHRNPDMEVPRTTPSHIL